MRLTIDKNIKNNCIAAILYSFLTYVMVYLPIRINLKETYIGVTESVFWSNYFWWYDYAISNHLNPLFNTHIFFPNGLNMSDGILPMTFFIPVTKLYGSVLSYNLYLLATFTVAGFGTFLLAKYLTSDKRVSFVAGIIFAFFPFHFGAAICHLHTFSILWVPFFVLYYIKIHEIPSKRNSTLAALFFSFNALTSWTIAIMLVIFGVIYSLMRGRLFFNKIIFKNFILFIVIAIFLMSPGLYVMLSEVLNNPNMTKSFGAFISHSADIFAFVTPSPYHPLWGDYSAEVYKKFTSNYTENLMFLGYFSIFLSTLGIFFKRKERNVKIFSVTCLVFLFLTLGPVLHVCGVYKFFGYDLTFILPGIIATKLPFLDMIRAPARYIIILMLGVSILSAYGLKWILEKLEHRGIGNAGRLSVVIISSVLILVEFMFVMPTQAVKKVPGFYHDLRDSGNKGPILELPMNLLGGRQNIIKDGKSDVDLMVSYYEYQKIHEKPFFGGYWSRIAPQYSEFLRTDPVLNFLATGQKEIFSVSGGNSVSHIKQAYGASHIVLHENFLIPSALDSITAYLGPNYSRDNSVKADPLIIYSAEEHPDSRLEANGFILSLGQGWHDLEYWGGAARDPSRWMSATGEIFVKCTSDKAAVLTFDANSYRKPRSIDVEINGDLHRISEEIKPDRFTQIRVTLSLKKGLNKIVIRPIEAPERPCDVSNSGNKDCRDLSIGIQKVHIES